MQNPRRLPGARSLSAAAHRLSDSTRWLSTRPLTATALAVGVLAVGVLAWALWPAPAPSGPQPRARAYKDVDVCLLTDSRGITTDPARQTWQGLQTYSRNTSVRVSYVQVTSPDTTANARTFLNGLIQRRCRVVTTIGTAPAAAAEAASPTTPATMFLVVGSSTAQHDQRNVVVISPTTDRLADAVSGALSRLASA